MNLSRLFSAALAIAMGAMLAGPVRAQQPPTGATLKSGPQTQTQTARPAVDPMPQGFSVVLVLGDMQGGSAPDSVPAAARKALADLKDFLPYKSYRLLDTQFTSCCGSSAIAGRLRGPDDQEYDLELNPRAAPYGKWSLRFVLREPGGPAGSAGDYSGALRDKELVLVNAQRSELERKLADLRQKLEERPPDVLQLKAQVQELERRADAMRIEETTRKVSAAAGARDGRRAVIDTSFTMDIGETVVVGTSRLKGDKALIALLTAVAQRKESKLAPGDIR
jgi:hypothetical protein